VRRRKVTVFTYMSGRQKKLTEKEAVEKAIEKRIKSKELSNDGKNTRLKPHRCRLCRNVTVRGDLQSGLMILQT